MTNFLLKNCFCFKFELFFFQNSGKDIISLLDVLRQELHSNDYNGEYFVRSAKKGVCDELGWFKCEGKFNTDICTEFHSINPYASKEARIVFSTWNLDHVLVL